MPKLIDKYGALWSGGNDDLKIEQACIRHGGRWKDKEGKTCGLGLFEHYRNCHRLLWPEDDMHRWFNLGLKTILENDVTILMGASDTSKTSTMSRYALIDWWVFPITTLFLVSSTDAPSLDLRIWGQIKQLFNRARERFPYLPGNVLETRKSITPDKIDEKNEVARLIDRGIVCVPCMQGGRWVGLNKFVGIKQKRLRHIGDETQFMSAGFLSAYANWYGKEDFKGMMSGNPLEPLDPLGRAAEPLEGWSAMPVPTKTATWKTTFYNGTCVNFVGTDSPNFDYPADEPVRFPYLISNKKLDAVAKTYGKDSMEWCSQCEGVMRPGLVGKRVITRELCRQHHAHDTAQWNGTQRTKIYACDPAYGGGDRCVGGWAEFGEGIDGRPILCMHEPEIIPISIKLDKLPEDQISEYIQQRLSDLDIPVENSFYDSFGKGTLGFSFAKLFGNKTPNPIDSGMRPTKRPVRFDLFIEENGTHRLKRCDEHYSKFITEMWFSVFEVIKGGQMRELPQEVMLEGCMREYCMVLGNKYELEPKADTKERMGKSPDLFDWCSQIVEGARQRGFKIQRLGNTVQEETTDDWLFKEAEEFDAMLKSKMLVHAGYVGFN